MTLNKDKAEILIDTYKKSAVHGMEHFLKVLSFVPEDKLDWTPAPKAKSAIRIAAHTALYAGRFARMIRDRRIAVDGDLTKWLAEREAEEAALTSRDEIERVFRKGTAEVLESLDNLKPEDVELILDSGQGWSMPITFLLSLPGAHAFAHTSQIDYLQTCWGDQEVHF